jgi:hypothetical protein
MTGNRITQDIGDDFFNDGHWYVLTSMGLGGMSPDELSDALQDDTGEEIRGLMENSICVPLAFDADCVLDLRTRFVVGDLSEEEESEWIARVQAPLSIPDGVFILVRGAMPEDFEEIGSDCKDGYVTVNVEPGEYVVEIYAFVGSYTVNELFYQAGDAEADLNENAPSTNRLRDWWTNTRGEAPLPEWLGSWIEDGYVDNDKCGLLAYVIRLIESDNKIPAPPQDEDYEWWVTEFQTREPDKCPRGIHFGSR